MICCYSHIVNYACGGGHHRWRSHFNGQAFNVLLMFLRYTGHPFIVSPTDCFWFAFRTFFVTMYLYMGKFKPEIFLWKPATSRTRPPRLWSVADGRKFLGLTVANKLMVPVRYKNNYSHLSKIIPLRVKCFWLFSRNSNLGWLIGAVQWADFL